MSSSVIAASSFSVRASCLPSDSDAASAPASSATSSKILRRAGSRRRSMWASSGTYWPRWSHAAGAFGIAGRTGVSVEIAVGCRRPSARRSRRGWGCRWLRSLTGLNPGRGDQRRAVRDGVSGVGCHSRLCSVTFRAALRDIDAAIKRRILIAAGIARGNAGACVRAPQRDLRLPLPDLHRGAQAPGVRPSKNGSWRGGQRALDHRRVLSGTGREVDVQVRGSLIQKALDDRCRSRVDETQINGRPNGETR